MAIPSNPSISRIMSEFAMNTRNSLNSSFRNAYLRVFGSVTTAVSNSRDFEGYGQPVVGNPTATATGAFSMDVTFNLSDRGGLNTFVQVQYSTSSDFSTGVTTEAPVGYTTTGNKTQSFNGLSASTLYYVRIRSWNKFNDEHVNDYIVSATDTLTTDAPPKFSTPSLSQLYHDQVSANEFFDAVISGGSADGVWANDYQVQSKDGANNWQTINDVSNSGWGTSGTKTGRWQLIGNENVPPKVRIRAVAQGQILQSDWSGEFTVMKKPLGIGVTQPSSGSGSLTASWSHPSGYTTFGVVLQWYLNGSLHSTDSLSAGATSASKTFSDGSQVKVRARYVGGEYTAFSSEITVDIVVTPGTPSNIQATGSQITWNHATNASYYQVQAKDSNDFTWQNVGTTNGDVHSIGWTPCNYTSVSGGFQFVDFDIRVRAWNGAQSGNWETAFFVYSGVC